jgi:tripartite-type tricarboxylate transporter receptor subunit TctC
MPFIEADKVTPIAVSSNKRIDSLPKLPTIAESGIPELKGFEATQWYGVVAKAGTPKEIINILNKGVQETFGSVTAREEVKKSGAIVELDSPEEFANFIRLEIDRWSKVVKAAGITPS